MMAKMDRMILSRAHHITDDSVGGVGRDGITKNVEHGSNVTFENVHGESTSNVELGSDVIENSGGGGVDEDELFDG